MNTKTNKPSRVQRKRTKGFKLPENTVCVNRPTKWGNPYKLIGDIIYGDCSHRRKFLAFGTFVEVIDPTKANQRLVELFIDWVNGNDHGLGIKPCPFTKKYIRSELKGKNLACFCKDGQACHGDYLLKIANC